MKKLFKSVMMLSIASLAILSSCSKEDDNATVTDVKVTFSTSVVNPVQENSVITMTLTATGTSDNKLKSVSVKRSGGNLPAKTILSKSLNATTATETLVDTIGSGTFTYTAILEGEKGTPASQVITIVTRAAYGFTESTSNNIDIYAQTGSDGSARFVKLTFPFTQFSLEEFNANKASIDLGFFYGSSQPSNNQFTLSSPTDGLLQSVYTGLTWTGVNDTKLTKTTLTAAQFDDIEASGSDSAILLYVASNPSQNWITKYANQLSLGNVLAFQTASGKYGFIKVANKIGSNADEAIISLRIVAQD